MNKMRNFLLALALILPGSVASAGIPFIGYGGETLVKVADLPDTEDYNVGGDFLDIGMLYKSVSIVFLPVWQYDKQYVLLAPGDNDSYMQVDQSVIFDVAKDANISLPPVSQISLGFWTAWGGKIIAALIVLTLILMYRAAEEKKRLNAAA